jgi:CRP/FNR family transcriptional regulator, cyclic AMP receptor protein
MSSLNNPQLPALGILEPLGDDDRDILSGYGEFLPVQPGEALITQGSDQNGLYFVISGKMHASALRGGHNVLLGTINRGETIGEINLLDSDCASASVTAIDFTQVWHINDESLEDYINAYPKPAAWLLIGIGKTIAKRLRAANEKVATLFG